MNSPWWSFSPTRLIVLSQLSVNTCYFSALIIMFIMQYFRQYQSIHIYTFWLLGQYSFSLIKDTIFKSRRNKACLKFNFWWQLFSLYKNLMVPAPTVFRHRQPTGCHRCLCNKLSTIHSKPKTFNCLKKYSIVIILIWAY